MARTLVLREFVHHIQAEPDELIGRWAVFADGAVPYPWPSHDVVLGMVLEEDLIDIVRQREGHTTDSVVVTPRPLPEPPVEGEGEGEGG